jgi:DNA-nicking Smr family endonuclease
MSNKGGQNEESKRGVKLIHAQTRIHAQSEVSIREKEESMKREKDEQIRAKKDVGEKRALESMFELDPADMTPRVDRRRGRVFRKVRGKIPKNQRLDLFKDIRGVLRLLLEKDKVDDIELLKNIKRMLTDELDKPTDPTIEEKEE